MGNKYDHAMAQAFHVWTIWYRFAEQIPVCRVIDPAVFVHDHEMDGILFAGVAVDAVYVVPQPLAQLISKRSGESSLPADEGQSNPCFYKDQDEIPAEKNA